MERIPVSGPWITQKEIDYVADAAANAWYKNANMYHERFEKAFATYLGVRFAAALPSCTSAIHLSLLALGIGPGDEVIVPDATWIASAAPVTYVGATTAFADVDRITWCLTAESFEKCITPRTKAVIPVALYGSMPDWDALLAVAAKHNIAVVEDAAEAIGSEYKGKRAGTFGRTGVFSFHGSKTLTTGEGGLLATDDEALFSRILFLRDHGRPPGDRMFYNTEVAQKYKMSSMQAALGLAQLERVEELITKKRQIFSWYQTNLRDVPGIRLNAEPPGTKNSYWMNTVILDQSRYALTKVQLMDLMSQASIDTRPFFHPLSSIPAYADKPEAANARNRNKVAYEISGSAINLPSGLNLTEDQVRYVSESLRGILKKHEK
ncbi:MAG TPA: DegT/DnrJ/EryC1/StrS family aminotransferase [Methylomirabilota bacterium]|nr:DegT/DnrJ/EryC1/StrS family aminotransferase [Methylomirabilota bacterium]